MTEKALIKSSKLRSLTQMSNTTAHYSGRSIKGKIKAKSIFFLPICVSNLSSSDFTDAYNICLLMFSLALSIDLHGSSVYISVSVD